MKKKISLLLIGMSFIILSVVACNSSTGQNDRNKHDDERKGTLELAQPPWVNSVPQAYMVKVVIEDHLGWEVNITEADIGVIFAAIANGTTDFFVDVWLPDSHEPFIEEHGDDIELLEPFTAVPPNGLVVPTYVDIDSIEELNEHRDKFNGEIIGIEPGAGLNIVTRDAIEAYGLDYTLVEGSDFAMTASIQDAVDNEEWIVTLGWSPHWKFTIFDLKYLEDPLEAFSDTRYLYPAISKDFKEKAPEVVDFLNKWEVEEATWDELIYQINIDEIDPETAVRNWLDDHQDIVDSWLE